MKSISNRFSMNQRGDSLIEITIAIAILSAVIVTTYVTANVAIRSGRGANERGDAVALEQQQAELLRNLRDNEVLSAAESGAGGSVGWNNFRHDIFPAGNTPLCSADVPAPGIKVSLPAGTGSNTDTYDISQQSHTIGTSTNTYIVKTAACYPDPINPTSIIFTVTANWQDGSSDNNSEFSTTLASVSDINQQPPAYDGGTP